MPHAERSDSQELRDFRSFARPVWAGNDRQDRPALMRL